MSSIEIIPCLSDNYAYIIKDEKTNKNILVDAPEHVPIERYLDENGMSLDFVLITHHHSDHIDGINHLKLKYAPKIIGAKRDRHRLPQLDIEVEEGIELSIGSKKFDIYDVDGHTLGHIAYSLADDRALFTGDSLMVMGCGRLFEGTPDDMWKSLKKLKGLPEDIMIYSGHEYTKSNIEFALSVDPQNEKLTARRKKELERLQQGIPTVPSTLREELDTNPFLREGDPLIADHLDMKNLDPISRFAKIRALKDNF
ncbi:MAG: hydroxyacylglutathione hydrolase [Rhodobacteraceae bacterium]|nr:hydroxyacylglutathione hydrolase [Paracoccaceae bacterium]